MDFFDTVAKARTPEIEDAEVKLDLTGLEKDPALQKLNTTLNACKRSKAYSLYVGFAPAKAGGGETLFQPLMRSLKVEKWNGYLSHAVPLISADKAGIFIVFKV